MKVTIVKNEHKRSLVTNWYRANRGVYHTAAISVFPLAKSPGIGARYGVRLTPAIVINDKLGFRGIPKEKPLRKKLQSI